MPRMRKKKKTKHNLFCSNILCFSWAKLIPYSYLAYLIRPLMLEWAQVRHCGHQRSKRNELASWKMTFFSLLRLTSVKPAQMKKKREIKNVISIAQGLNWEKNRRKNAVPHSQRWATRSIQLNLLRSVASVSSDKLRLARVKKIVLFFRSQCQSTVSIAPPFRSHAIRA